MIPIGRPSAAIDPVGLFVAFIIIVNLISAFARRMRVQRTAAQASPAQSAAPSSRLDDATRKAAADAAASRQAQRARMEQAIRAAQARLQQQLSATPPVAVTQAPPPVAAPVAIAPPQPETLPSFDYAQGMLPATMQMPGAAAAPSGPLTLPVLGSRLTGMEVFVAAAIVGPPAALRSFGHTPAGW